jgi:hypothetical protein
VAYGPAPGLELIPYFLGLLAWAGLALTAVVLWPLAALRRRFRRARGPAPAEPRGEPLTPPLPESSGEGRHDSR